MKMTLQCIFSTPGKDDIQFETVLERPESLASGGEQALFIELETGARAAFFRRHELEVLPKVNDLTAHSGRKVHGGDISKFFGAINAGELWFEIENTFLHLRAYLAEAHAYKLAEPPPEEEGEAAVRIRYHAHFQKMLRFDCSVYSSVKLQDLVVRLMFEHFGSAFIDVDQSKHGWERKLKMELARSGLNRLKNDSILSVEEYDTITSGLDGVGDGTNLPIIEYRNRLMHRLRASVDYPELYTHLQNQNGTPLLDANGKEYGREYSFTARQRTPEFYFDDLYAAMVKFASQLAGMLNKLKSVPSLS